MKDKSTDNIVQLVEKQKVIPRKLYVMRRVTNGKISPAAIALAKACAEDANTAYYVKEYNEGNFTAREDFIEYMADKFQFIINGGKI